MKLVTLVFIITTLLGCAATGSKTESELQVTDTFTIGHIDLSVDQKVTPDITYHTEAEIKQIVSDRIKHLLKDDGLLSTNKDANTLNISLIYKRRFVGDATPLPSDSLAYPHFDYEIEFLDQKKVLKTISKKNLEYRGGFLMNLKVISSSLKDKSDEFPFMESLSKSVVKSIKDME